mmetsp:Transcript_3400/g.6552  ORF Transcript_3400/g.6552 Transcript_3400/m.6552 type:complete len:1192 (-) Transcript_3400:141-3716(-)
MTNTHGPGGSDGAGYGIRDDSRRRSSVQFTTIAEVDEDDDSSKDWEPSPVTGRPSYPSGHKATRPSKNSNAGAMVDDASSVTKSSKFLSAIRRLTTGFSDNERTSTAESSSNNTRPHIPGRESIERRNRTTLWNRGTELFGEDRSSFSNRERSRLEISNNLSLRKTGCLPEIRMAGIHDAINHMAWKFIYSICTIVMLFGTQIQDLYFPKSWDIGADVFFTLVFAFCVVDSILRSVVDPQYFTWVFQKGSLRFGRFHLWKVRVGSFMFWCDVLATGSFLYEISYVSPPKQSKREVVLTLSKLGVPISGLSSVNNTVPVELEYELLVTLGRVARIARFVRTSAVVEAVSRLNCTRFFFLGYWSSLLPTNFCRLKQELRKSIKQDASVKGSMLGSSGNMRALRLSSRKNDDVTGNGIPLERRVERSHSYFFNEAQKEDRRDSALSSGKSSGVLVSLNDSADSSNNSRKGWASAGRNFFDHIADNFSSNKKTGDGGSQAENDHANSSLKERRHSKESSSHVGSAMRELTGMRVAAGIMLAFLLTVLFTYTEDDGTMPMTMIPLHGQTSNEKFASLALDTAKSSVIPELYSYVRMNGTDVLFNMTYADVHIESLREREILNVTIKTIDTSIRTVGVFDNRRIAHEWAKVEIYSTLFAILVWIIGVTSFAGPVMTLVVAPIERMIFLLSMLRKDPLGYENTPQYNDFISEGREDTYNSFWTAEVLKGMETNFLMSTILRIGSLMKVGFGSAGVEIIRNNLEKGRRKDVLFLNKQGSAVSCIFLFCDIRGFTDVTETLQEEVFVFTNKIAAVVHSICNSYGGAANKNIGDAFLLSWLLDEPPEDIEDETVDDSFKKTLDDKTERLFALNNQADKALLSVIKISIALHFDDYFVENMNGEARNRLLAKMSKRKGPLVQMGFGLHAGKAVQGAIGSQRKLDATYISESVERAEFLESNTKTYGVPVLMSDAFYNLLDPSNRYRCRKVDQLLLSEQEESTIDAHDLIDSGEKMELYTYDMDIDALFSTPDNEDDASVGSEADMSIRGRRRSMRRSSKAQPQQNTENSATNKRRSLTHKGVDSFRFDSSADLVKSVEDTIEKSVRQRRLVLPTGMNRYSDRVWLDPDMKRIRRVFVSNGIFFSKFDDGLKSYYARDWSHAKSCFELILSKFGNDGPSKYFLGCIEEHGGVPPRDFIGYGRV